MTSRESHELRETLPGNASEDPNDDFGMASDGDDVSQLGLKLSCEKMSVADVPIFFLFFFCTGLRLPR